MNIIVVAEGGVVQNILCDEPLNGNIYILDYYSLSEEIVYKEIDREKLNDLICYKIMPEIDKQEINKRLLMTYKDFLKEDCPEYLEELEGEENE